MTLLGDSLHLWRTDTAIKMAPIFHSSLYCFPTLERPCDLLWPKESSEVMFQEQAQASRRLCLLALSLGELLCTQAWAGLLEDERPHGASWRPQTCSIDWQLITGTWQNLATLRTAWPICRLRSKNKWSLLWTTKFWQDLLHNNGNRYNILQGNMILDQATST